MDVERSIQNILLDHPQLSALVRKAFLHCQKLDGWTVLSGGALNTTYKTPIGHDAFALRIYARDRAHCKTEKAIHQLIDKSVSIPKLVYADEANEPCAYSIFEFVSGFIFLKYLTKRKLLYPMNEVMLLPQSINLNCQKLDCSEMVLRLDILLN